MNLSVADFAAFHAAVHDGKEPFVWQQCLLEQIVREKKWPRVLDLPTSAGKTTCIDIALFALALDAASGPEERWCPRRIVMVVDRRVIVDQAAERGRAILRALRVSSNAAVIEVAKRLRLLSRAGEEPVGVFTLRGGIPKDDGWARTPDQPLIIASTVDQIGSRMLMQGYGVSQSMRPVHAGLLANDTLLLLDEAHLSEPFRQTLDQLTRLRARFSNNGMRTRFCQVFLSATPVLAGEQPFELPEEDKRPDSPLGPRLHVRKPTRIVEVDDRMALANECVKRAKALLERHRTIAVVVNRVATAGEIARCLRENVEGNVIVTLLTGRMRPLDRDDVLNEIRPAVQSGRERSDDTPKRVVVATQCIEAGADFDFDALVTEAASLDSLRQRFGRVDRLGGYAKGEGVIVYDTCAKLKQQLKERDGKSSLRDHDPIYGTAILETVKWLRAQVTKKRPFVDFGVLALKPPQVGALGKLLAPKPNAPILLPAYLDLWAQTYPAPSQVPDVSLWLHGPSAGPADVKVIWRADLTEEVLQRGDVETATAIVSAVRPSSLEAMSLPFSVAQAWLAEEPVPDFADTEGPQGEEAERAQTGGRLALRWKGDESEIIRARSDSSPSLKPGDTIIVPSTYGGILNGCFDPSSTVPVLDRAEQAEFFARARPTLRLHPAVLSSLGLSVPCDDPEEVRGALGRLAANAEVATAWPAWKRLWARALSVGRGSIIVRSELPWVVLRGNRVEMSELRDAGRMHDSIENGIELTTDGDDSFYTGRAVSLSEHSADVEKFAREYATRCGLNPWLAAHVALAAWLHDIGKADRRFQVMLRGGSEIEFFKDDTLLAKSAIPPGAWGARRLAQRRSGYPCGGRHEVQSLAMLEGQSSHLREFLRKIDPNREPDIDLVLHLVASHHGYCRPFATVVIDDTPVDVSLTRHESEAFGVIDIPPITSKHELHRLNASVGDRFWRLVSDYGWHELCWLEAILRLADHRASEEEENATGTS